MKDQHLPIDNIKQQQSELRLAGIDLGLWSHGFGLPRRARQIFSDVDFENRTMLEVGCGEGVFTMWAALHGARQVVALEPMGDGMNPARDPRLKFEALRSRLGLSNVELRPDRLQDFQGPRDYFDIVHSFDSVNHWDEPSCVKLRDSQSARSSYLSIFRHLHRMMKAGGTLIVIDVSCRNLFGDIGIHNPFAPSIDWQVHQEPEEWMSLLGEVGFGDPSLKWLSGRTLRYLGLPFVSRSLSYATDSYFRIQMTCQKA